MATARLTQVSNRTTIADTFVHLVRGVDEITLQLQSSPVRYPVSVTAVDRALGRCGLAIAGLDDIYSALREPQPFVLRIRQVAGTIITSPMQTRTAEPDRHNGLKLRCALPRVLTLSRRRSDFRAALAKTMRVDVRLCAGDQEYACQLSNLSVGGCLVCTANSSGLDPKTRDMSCDLQLYFPNGHSLALEGYVRRVYQASGHSSTYIAVRFTDDFDERHRGLWFYVCEIEREAVRQANGREGLRALAPSRLFMQDTQTEPQAHSV